jgi:hypothetical protein
MLQAAVQWGRNLRWFGSLQRSSRTISLPVLSILLDTADRSAARRLSGPALLRQAAEVAAPDAQPEAAVVAAPGVELEAAAVVAERHAPPAAAVAAPGAELEEEAVAA